MCRSFGDYDFTVCNLKEKSKEQILLFAFLFNKIPLDFSRSGFYKLGVTDFNFFDVLVAYEGAVDFVDFLFEYSVYLLVSSTFGEMSSVGVDNSGENHVIRVFGVSADNHTFRNHIDRLEIFFDFFGENVFAVFKHDYRLFTSGDK